MTSTTVVSHSLSVRCFKFFHFIPMYHVFVYNKTFRTGYEIYISIKGVNVNVDVEECTDYLANYSNSTATTTIRHGNVRLSFTDIITTA
jgi:hypothetical protein